MGPINLQGRVWSGRNIPVTRRIAERPPVPFPTPPLAGQRSMAQQVFEIPELLGLILTNLPPGPLHHAMEISTRFCDTIKPTLPHSVAGMRVALGLRFRRRIEDMTDSERLDLTTVDNVGATTILLYDVLDQIIHRRFHWLLNVTLDPINASVVREKRHVSVPTLAIDPFHIVRISRGDHVDRSSSSRPRRIISDDTSTVMSMRFTLFAKGYECDTVTTRGIVKADKLYPNDGRASWSGVKLLTMPFDVRVCVGVDFRDAMHAPFHHTGHCQVPGCQVGRHGIQETSILFPAAQATLGNLVTFLNGVEYHANENAKLIRRQTTQTGYRSQGEWCYMGLPSLPPPKIQREWRGWW